MDENNQLEIEENERQNWAGKKVPSAMCNYKPNESVVAVRKAQPT